MSQAVNPAGGVPQNPLEKQVMDILVKAFKVTVYREYEIKDENDPWGSMMEVFYVENALGQWGRYAVAEAKTAVERFYDGIVKPELTNSATMAWYAALRNYADSLEEIKKFKIEDEISLVFHEDMFKDRPRQCFFVPVRDVMGGAFHRNWYIAKDRSGYRDVKRIPPISVENISDRQMENIKAEARKQVKDGKVCLGFMAGAKVPGGYKQARMLCRDVPYFGFVPLLYGANWRRTEPDNAEPDTYLTARPSYKPESLVDSTTGKELPRLPAQRILELLGKEVLTFKRYGYEDWSALEDMTKLWENAYNYGHADGVREERDALERERAEAEAKNVKV